jgi:sensor histidine kinase YesM
MVMALSVAGLFSTLSLAVWTISEFRGINATTRDGLELISDARRVHVLMKDMLVGVFTPRTYGVLKDLVHLEVFHSTRRAWENSSEEFFLSYAAFLDQPRLRRLVAADEGLSEELEVARRLLERTVEMTESLEGRLDELEARGILGREDTYYLIQRAADPLVVPVFDEIRETSFYLTNTFESFLHHFVSSLEEQAALLQRRLVWGLGIFAILISAVTLTGTWLLSRTIVQNVHAVATAMKALSRGDFTARPAIHSADEFGELSDNFSGFLDDLRRNVNVVLDLQHNLQHLAGHERPVQEVFPLVCRTVKEGIGADGVVILASNGETVASTGEVALPGNGLDVDDDRRVPPVGRDAEKPGGWRDTISAGMAGPQAARIVLHRKAGGFTELEQTILKSYAEFSQLLIENHVSYAELLERRNAQYEALQAQIRPHFLYNVLNNIIGLNRLEDRRRLEESVVALKEILRYSLGQERFSTLGEEIRIARRYCSLQELRFDDRISFDLSCPEDLATLPMPKLILQPLVENAIIHGLEPMAERGRLTVTAYRSDEEHVDVTVIDNGIGFDDRIEPPADGATRGTHIGLRNIEQRLRAVYTGARLTVSSRPGEGTTCVLRVPATVTASEEQGAELAGTATRKHGAYPDR